MLKIGITGGIGSGKSIISKIIESMGYGVFNSDRASKEIVAGDPDVRKGLIALFGNNVYTEFGLNREFLARIIFNDDEAREKVNGLIHPKVRQAFEIFASQQTQNLVFNEAAILFETGVYRQFDKMVLVTAPKDLKVERVIARDKLSEVEVMARMDGQWTDERKVPLADFVIINDDQKPVLTQVEELITNLLS